MSIFFDLLVSLSFSIHSFCDFKSYDEINSTTYKVFKDKTRKAILLAMSIINYVCLAVLIVFAFVEIGSQIDLDTAARRISIIQILANILVYVSVIPISYFKRKKIVRSLVREFEISKNEPYTDDELYEYLRGHIVITKKEMSRMLRAIQKDPG